MRLIYYYGKASVFWLYLLSKKVKNLNKLYTVYLKLALKLGVAIPVAAAMAGIVFALWFIASSFLPPILAGIVPSQFSFLIFILMGLILTSIYTFIHYKLQSITFWPALLVGAGVGWLAAYLLHSIISVKWFIEPWLIGLGVFLTPPAIISVISYIFRKGPTIAQAESIEPEPVIQQTSKTETVPVEQPQPQPIQQEPKATPKPVAEEQVVSIVSEPITLPSQELLRPVEKIDSEEIEDYLLEYIEGNKLTEIVPVPSSSADGGYFPAIQDSYDLDTSRLMILLKRLLDKGVLKIGGIQFKKIVCPRCFSALNMISINCKSCKSPNLSRQRILQHESCGFLGPEERFSEGGRNLCPRCGTEVSIASEPGEEGMHVKLKVHSSLFICYQCNEVNPEPYVSFKCMSCGMDYDYNSLELKTFYRYVINPAALSKALEHNRPIKVLSEKIRSLGYSVERNKTIIGSSHLAHRIDLVVKHDAKPTTAIVFIKTEKKDDQVNTIMKVMTMKLDLSDLDFYVLSYYSLHNEAKRIAELFNIWCEDAILLKDLTTVVSSLFNRLKVM